MNEDNIQKLITEAFAIVDIPASDRNDIGYMSNALIRASLPHSKPKTNKFVRVNGNYTMTIVSTSNEGLPYGSIPRLLLAWITTEAVKTKNRNLSLGTSLSVFMKAVGLSVQGRSITALKNQMDRLFSSLITVNYKDENNGKYIEGNKNLLISSEQVYWWNKKKPNQEFLFESEIVLTQEFFDEILKNPVPIDLRALRALRALKALKKKPFSLRHLYVANA